jgi:hypothetical protein
VEEHRLMVFENKMPGNVFGEAKKGFKNYIMRNYNLYSSPNILKVPVSREMRWIAHVACIGK